MAAILTNGVLTIRTAPIFQPRLAPAREKGCGSTKARDVPPPMPRIVRSGGRQHRLELDAGPDGQAHSQPTDQPPSPPTPAGAAWSQQSPRVVNQPPTARPVTRLALPTSPPHRRTPKLLATRPSFVTRYRPPASTHCTHPSPINRRNNRLKFFPLAPPPPPPPPPLSLHPPPPLFS